MGKWLFWQKYGQIPGDVSGWDFSPEGVALSFWLLNFLCIPPNICLWWTSKPLSVLFRQGLEGAAFAETTEITLITRKEKP